MDGTVGRIMYACVACVFVMSAGIIWRAGEALWAGCRAVGFVSAGAGGRSVNVRCDVDLGVLT